MREQYVSAVGLADLKIPATGTRVLLAEAKRRGLDIGQLIRANHLDPASLMNDPDFLIPSASLRAIWKGAHEESGDPLLGLHTALLIPENAYPVTDHLVRVAANVNDAFLSVSRYWKVTIPSLQMSFRSDQTGATFELSSLTPLGIGIPREMIEYTFALILKRIRSYSVRNWAPIKVTFQGRCPLRPNSTGAPSEHERIFGCPVSFESAINSVCLSTEDLAIPQKASDPSLFALLTRFADQELLKQTPFLPPTHSQIAPKISDITSGGGIIQGQAQAQGQGQGAQDADTRSRLKRALEASLSSGDISVEAIASRLAMSSRTLQRKLETEGTTYQEVLDDLRKNLAEEFLKQRAQGKMTVDDISFLLGYSEPSAFYKAYRRWTGKSLPGKSAA